MLSEPPATKPRRNWHLLRWAFLLIALSFGWGAWKAYDFRQAVKEAGTLGWGFQYSDPIALIREDWRAAFRKETWNDTARSLDIQRDDPLDRHFDVIRRLEPNELTIGSKFPLRDLSELQGLSNLTSLWLFDCPNLTNIDVVKDMKELTSLGIANCPSLSNIDALKELKKLEYLDLSGCSALTNVDAFRNLKALISLELDECTGLKNVNGLLGLTHLKFLSIEFCDGLPEEALDALKSALPTTRFRSSIQNWSTPPPEHHAPVGKPSAGR